MFTLKIETDNAAFGETPQECLDELARILEVAAGKLRRGKMSGNCMDANGNIVGSFELALDMS